MRLVRIKLGDDVLEYLKTLCIRFQVNDLAFVSDLYALALTAGNKLPDDARLLLLAEAYAKLHEIPLVMVKLILTKRRHLLKTLSQSPVFQVSVLKQKLHPRLCTEFMLEFYTSVYKRIRQAQCLTCHLMSNCKFGQTYGNDVTTIHIVVDPDYEAKIHPDCPEKPFMDMLDQMNAANKYLQSLANNPGQLKVMGKNDPAAVEFAEDLSEVSAQIAMHGDPTVPDGAEDAMPTSIDENWEEEDDVMGLDRSGSVQPHSSTAYYTTKFLESGVKLNAKRISEIQMHSFLIFELSRKLSAKLVKAHKGKFKPTAEITKHQKTTNIKSVADAARVLPKEHAQADHVFDHKLQKRQLVMRQSEEPDSKKHLLYLLVDTSDSMNSCVATGTHFWAVVTRALLSASFSLALIELIESEHGIVFMRGFDGCPSALHSARTKEEYEMMKRFITNCRYNGGSTDIIRALKQAIEDIVTAKSELRDAEILLITDCGDTITKPDVVDVKAKLGKTVLNTLDVSSGNHQMELAAGEGLRQLSDHYFRMSGTAASLDSLISLVGGKKFVKPTK